MIEQVRLGESARSNSMAREIAGVSGTVTPTNMRVATAGRGFSSVALISRSPLMYAPCFQRRGPCPRKSIA